MSLYLPYISRLMKMIQLKCSSTWHGAFCKKTNIYCYELFVFVREINFVFIMLQNDLIKRNKISHIEQIV